MFATLFSITLFVALFQSVFADFTIDTPSFVQCQDSQITWTSATGPYTLLAVPADDVCGEALQDLGDQTGLSMTYKVNIAAGTQVVLFLEDSNGDEAWSGTITVGASNDTSCLGTSTGSAASPSGTVSDVSCSLTIPPSGGAAAPSGTPFAPAGAANAGLDPVSGALSMRPLSALSVIGSAVVAAVAFAL
ncbi:hypothetical protein HYDPIDRAFT_180615 [Hydnomerulius pinastri MD-312]|nr:hypothetical protein HYDPIDRAFT_180615 [Hydnomerulius pinastri MD-312]